MSTGPERQLPAGVGPRNVRTGDYHKQFALLPIDVRQLADAAFEIFREDPDHPALHRKTLKITHRGRHRQGSQSVRISRQYRAIYVLDGDTNVWYWVGSHADYDNFVGRI